MAKPRSQQPATDARRTRLSDRQAAAIARALSDPRRYGILREVAAAPGALPCCALRAAGDVSAATISHHIKGLEAADLLEVSRDGKFAMLSFRPETFQAYLDYLAESLHLLESGPVRNT